MKLNNGNLIMRPFQTGKSNVRKEVTLKGESEALYQCITKKLGNCNELACWKDLKTGGELFKNQTTILNWFLVLRDDNNHKLVMSVECLNSVIGSLSINVNDLTGDEVVVNLELSLYAFEDKGRQYLNYKTEHNMNQFLENMIKVLTDESVNHLLINQEVNQEQSSRFVANVTSEVEISGRADHWFHLACPHEELKWIEGWKYEMIQSESGVNERHCIFMENISSKVAMKEMNKKTFWYTTDWDEKKCTFRATLLTPGFTLASFKLSATNIGNNKSLWSWRTQVIGLNEQANKKVQKQLKKGDLLFMTELTGIQLKYYIENHKIYKVPLKKKLYILGSLIHNRLNITD